MKPLKLFEDRRALERLGTLLTAVASAPDRLRALVALAGKRGFEFDD